MWTIIGLVIAASGIVAGVSLIWSGLRMAPADPKDVKAIMCDTESCEATTTTTAEGGWDPTYLATVLILSLTVFASTLAIMGWIEP